MSPQVAEGVGWCFFHIAAGKKKKIQLNCKMFYFVAGLPVHHIEYECVIFIFRHSIRLLVVFCPPLI